MKLLWVFEPGLAPFLVDVWFPTALSAANSPIKWFQKEIKGLSDFVATNFENCLMKMYSLIHVAIFPGRSKEQPLIFIGHKSDRETCLGLKNSAL
jgi:hypothetical protein